MSRSEIPKSQISTCTKSGRRRLLRARKRTASCGSLTTAVAVRRRGRRLLRLFHRPHPPTYISNQFSMSRYQGDSRYAGIGDHGYTPVTAGKRPTGNPADRFSGCGGKRLTPRQPLFPPREELPTSDPRLANHLAGSTSHTVSYTRVTRVPTGS